MQTHFQLSLLDLPSELTTRPRCLLSETSAATHVFPLCPSTTALIEVLITPHLDFLSCFYIAFTTLNLHPPAYVFQVLRIHFSYHTLWPHHCSTCVVRACYAPPSHSWDKRSPRNSSVPKVRWIPTSWHAQAIWGISGLLGKALLHGCSLETCICDPSTCPSMETVLSSTLRSNTTTATKGSLMPRELPLIFDLP